MSGRKTTTMEGGGGTVCCCWVAVTSLAMKLTQLMDSRPVARDALQELATDDEHVAAWKMILEMAYGVQDWTDPKVAAELGKPEAERERIQEIQAEITDARRRCLLVDDRVIDGTSKGQDDATPSESGVDNGREEEKTVVVSGDSYPLSSASGSASPARWPAVLGLQGSIIAREVEIKEQNKRSQEVIAGSGSASPSSPAAVSCRSFPPIQSAVASARQEPATSATEHQVSSSAMAATMAARSGVMDRRPRPRDASYISTESEGEEVVEEFFGELWAVPACHFRATNKQHSSSNRRCLVWIRRELFVAGSFTAKDCYPAKASDRRLQSRSPRISASHSR